MSTCISVVIILLSIKEIEMKRLFGLLCILIFSIAFVSCSREVVQDTPQNTLFLMQNAIDNQDYEAFQKFLLESKRVVYTKDDLEALKDMGATGGGQITNYYLCEYPNGEKVLFEVTPSGIDGKYFIQDIIPIPEEAKDVFNGRKGK
jgi:hypothetical protein